MFCDFKLNDVNDEMNTNYGPLAEKRTSANGPVNSALLHTIQRHRDILQDYSSEFQRLKTNIHGRLEREQLLTSTGSRT